VLTQADVALLASGTVALQALLHGCPMVVAYKLAPSTYRILKWTNAYKAKFFSLPNIIADKVIVEEFVQDQAEAPQLSKALIKLLDNRNLRQNTIDSFAQIHAELKQDTNQKVADIVIERLRKTHE